MPDPRPPTLLVVKTGPIGDLVMALPMIEAARARDPDVSITWICGESCRPLLERVGGGGLEIIAIDDRRLMQGSFVDRARIVGGVWKRMRGRRFDLAVIGHAHPRFAWFASGATSTTTRAFSFARPRPWPVPGRHHSAEYVRLVTGVDGAEARAPAYPPWTVLPSTFAARGAARRVALCPGGALPPRRESLRRWPLERYRETAEALLRAGAEVVLSGGPDDRWVLETFAGLGVIDAVGTTTVAQTVDLLAACDAVVAHDGGPLHLADLAGVPIVALFGPTDPRQLQPIRSRTTVVWGGEQLACRPCYDGIGYPACARSACLDSISPARVVAALDGLLASTSAGAGRPT